MRRVKVTVTTAADGSATAYTPRVAGTLKAISYVKPGSGGYDNGVDFDISSEATGEVFWDQDNVNATAHVHTRPPAHTYAGVAGLYAAAGEGVLADGFPLASDRIKIVIASGGNAKTGAFHFFID